MASDGHLIEAGHPLLLALLLTLLCGAKIFNLKKVRERSKMSWSCAICGVEHDELPDCFGIDAPWRALVPENEFMHRVELTADQCVVDRKEFFIRGHVQIPIHGHSNPLAFSVWSSLSEASFRRMCDRWNDVDRDKDPPYFGWLCSPISIYPSTIHLKLNVNSRLPGFTPLFTVLDEEHLLAIDQRNGISLERWHKVALQLTS